MTTKNDNYDWLTYESVFNKPRFRKPNKKFEMRLYLVPREKVSVWFREGLEDDFQLLGKLTLAFFPEFNARNHLKLSNREWEWKNVKYPGDIKSAVTPQVSQVSAARSQIVLQQPPQVVLPYNVYDNGSDSRALGTKTQDGFKQFKPDKIWEFWKTASRSCVVRLKEIVKGDSWADKILPDWTEWNFDAGKPDRAADFENVKLNFLLKDTAEPTLYSLKTYAPFDVSLKTGVNFVGSHKQANKDILDDNWIVACLRSDYVTAVEKEMRGKTRNPASQDILVLTELLSINEKDKRAEGTAMVRDGVQVRDISKLDRTKLYFGPLSIPFVNVDLQEFHNEFAKLDEKDWRDYWKRHWAASLGQAKALFLLRYGLQHINPNVQNYLIEFNEPKGSAPVPTGRIVIRDLQDASIHREVVWALYGIPGEDPPEGADKKAELSKLNLPVLKYEFEKALDESQETGSTDTAQFGPTGTQFLWQRFSTFMNGTKITTFQNQEPFKTNWQKLLTTMAEWGKAHNRAYVGCVEHQFGINFTEIKWEEIPNPEVYGTLKSINEASSKCLGIAYRASTTSGVNPPTVNAVSESNFPWSPTKWKEVFGDTVPVGQTSAPCVLVQGDKFQHPSVKIDETEAQEIVFSKDGKSLYVKTAAIETRNLVTQKKATVTVINHEKAGKVNPIGMTACKSAVVGDMGWEENAAQVVHNYLRSKDGQKAIRDYKARGWKPVEPLFRLRVSDNSDQPLEEFLVFMTNRKTGKTWTDMTDINGEIHIYGGEKTDYGFKPKIYDISIPFYMLEDVKGTNIFEYDANKLITKELKENASTKEELEKEKLTVEKFDPNTFTDKIAAEKSKTERLEQIALEIKRLDTEKEGLEKFKTSKDYFGAIKITLLSK